MDLTLEFSYKTQLPVHEYRMAEEKFTTPSRPLTWLITGCSSGLGLHLVREVQSHGDTVIATSRNPSKTPDLVAEVVSKGGRWLSLDVTDQSCHNLVDEQEQSGTHIDILVNNAGGSIHGTVEQMDEDEARWHMDLNYFGPYRLIRAVLPHMRKRRFGVIANISSGAGLEARPSMGGYAAAKAALDGKSRQSLACSLPEDQVADPNAGLTKVLHKEVAPFNIRAFYVSLGTFDTNMPAAAGVQKAAWDPDYKGSMAEKLTSWVTNGTFKADGDPAKAAKAIYEVAAAKGIGAGNETEYCLPLGRDLAVRVQEVVDRWKHTMEVFGDVANSVYIEKQPVEPS